MSREHSETLTAESSRGWYRSPWPTAVPFAVAITLFLLAIFSYWFSLADRYRVFLYYHDMGPLYPDTSPFSPVTASRYWMSALVGSGAVLVAYVATNWMVGRLSNTYRPPAWWQVWVLCALPLTLAIPLITMSLNQPTLPARNALQVTLAALTGLALALTPGRMAARRPLDLLLLSVDGLALMLLLTAAPGLERLGRWLEGGNYYYIGAMALGAVAGLFLLLALTILRTWRRRPAPSWWQMFVAGLCVAYLLIPLLHHVGFTDGYYYISDADNFFSRDLGLQLAIWLVIALLATGVTWLRKWLYAWRLRRQADGRVEFASGR
ncbi:MAG: hypothetical protein JSW55_08485 [Chloroflexota bacterium]|nr:MAG: hypothetical protein JSW55_08485 [Chloroflexota bacterium]